MALNINSIVSAIDDWSSGQIRVEANSQTQNGSNSLVGFRLPAITINNMI